MHQCTDESKEGDVCKLVGCNHAESAVQALVSQKEENALQPLPKIRTQGGGKTFTLIQEFFQNSLVSLNHFVRLIFAFITVEMRGWPGASPFFIRKPELA